MSRLFITFLLLMVCPTGSQAEALSREKIDGWLQHLGASDKFDASKGIDWGVMPGPFYTPELGLGIGTAVVGLYRPDPQDTTSQNSTLTLSGYASSTGAFGLSVKNYTFSIVICGAFCRRVDSQHAHLLGQGFHAGDKDNEKEVYRPVLTLRPTLYRQLIDHVYLGAGWSLAAQNADEMDHDDRPKMKTLHRDRRYSAPAPASISTGTIATLSLTRAGVSMPTSAIPTMRPD
ncbi:hypothetical protein BANRA_05276 [Klebsiella pneumoniae]|nr:hypothetical protein BANRA_05276 [Klebsiella pneumoniae]